MSRPPDTPEAIEKREKADAKNARRRKMGLEWQDKVRDAIAVVCRFSHNPNNTGGGFGGGKATTPGDRIACYRGRLVLVEAKDVAWSAQASLNRFERKDFRFSEEEALWQVTADGGLAVVAIRWKHPDGDRAWLCHYADLVHWMRLRGEVQVRLDQPQAFFVPMIRRRFKGHGERWDIGSALEALREQGCPEPFELQPNDELADQIAAAKQRKKDRKAKDAARKAAKLAAALAQPMTSPPVPPPPTPLLSTTPF